MSLVDVIGLLVPASFFGLMLFEAIAPARRLAAQRGWRLVGVAFFVLLLAISITLPLAIPSEWVERYRLLDLSGLGVAGGFLVGWVLYTFVGYVWHRSCHASPLMWKLFHQMHHAPRRLDVASSAVFHPTESVAYTVITVVVTVFVLGLDPVAAALVGSFGAFVSVFQHANIRTPRWLGLLVQRPESHGLHHEVGGPRGNYADLPLWDILFGTFRNPDRFDGEVGLEESRDIRWAAMLGFRDVSRS